MPNLRTGPSGIIVIVTACFASLVLSAGRRAHVASRGDVEQVAQAVRGAYREGDLIVVVPYHQGIPRELLGDLPLVELRHLEPELLRLHSGLLLIAFDAIGKRDDLVKGVEALGTVTEVAKAGAVSASRIAIAAPSRVVFDARRDLQQVYVTSDSAPCTAWNGSRWSCPGAGDWNWVGRVITSIGDGPRACIWMHPPDRQRPLERQSVCIRKDCASDGASEPEARDHSTEAGLPPAAGRGGRAPGSEAPYGVQAEGGKLIGVLEVTLPPVMASVLVIGHGFANTATPRRPVHLEVRRGERLVDSIDASVKEVFDVERIALGESSDAPVTLRVSSTDNAGAHFCLNAWLVE